MRQQWGVLLGILASLLFTAAFAATPAKKDSSKPPADATPVSEASGIARSEKDVPVPQPKPDDAIKDRLIRILTITAWFKNLEVTSQEGVVTLRGEVAEATQRDWAVKLAQDAEGVVAVVNKVTLKEGGWFDLDPTEKEVKKIWKSFFASLPHLLIAAVIFAIAFFFYRRLSKFSRRFWRGRISNPILSEVMGKIGALPILLLGLYLMLAVLDLTGLAFTILGGTGALGLVAGFAFKNILENYFSGIILSIRKPFIIGDVIQVGNEKGVVFRMTTRGITLLDFDGTQILIPNSTVFTSILKNQTANPLSRVHMIFDVNPERTVDEQRQEIVEYLRNRPEVVKEPETETFISGKDKDQKIEVYFWINIRETSGDRLKAVITSQFKPNAASGEAKVRSEKPVSTRSEVAALLQRASQHPLPDPSEKSLVHEHREGSK
jgi:small conductance mechanosensitive channel